MGPLWSLWYLSSNYKNVRAKIFLLNYVFQAWKFFGKDCIVMASFSRNVTNGDDNSFPQHLPEKVLIHSQKGKRMAQENLHTNNNKFISDTNLRLCFICSVHLLLSYFAVAFPGSRLSYRSGWHFKLKCVDISNNFILIFAHASTLYKQPFQHNSIKYYEYSSIFKCWKV